MAWCGKNHLILNVNKTKEMTVDFRRIMVNLSSISIVGEVVEYRYFLVSLDNILDWRSNTDADASPGTEQTFPFLNFLSNVGPSVFAIRCCISSTSLLWKVPICSHLLGE